MSGDQVDLDAIERRRATVNVWSGDELFTIEMIVDEDVPALVAEVRRLRAKVERVEAAVSDNGPRTMMLADDVRAALEDS